MNDAINAILCASPQATTTAADGASDTLLDLLMRGLSPSVFVVLIILVIFSFLSFRLWRKMQLLFTYGLLLKVSLVVFVAGCFVYTTGALQSDHMGLSDAIYTIPSGIISSLGMFVYQDDISELSDRAKHCSEFMACYSLVHLAAAIITSLIMIRWVGMLLYYRLRLCRFKKESSELYLLWGITPASLSLAKSIRLARPKEEIVFVNAPDEEDDSNINMHRMLDIIKLKDDVDRLMVEIDAMVVNCYADVTDSSLCNAKSIERFLRYNVRLPQLSKIVRHAEQLHVFFLSTDETKNINATRNLASIAQTEEKRRASLGRDTHIYCHARRSPLTQVFESENIKNYNLRLRLHIIDSSKLSVQMLKKNIGDCPVSFVQIDKDTATVCSAFRSMIIGFGETGEEAFKFLYEFGAFIDKAGHKSPFCCTVVDPKATALKENFVSKNPCLKDGAGNDSDMLFFVNAKMYDNGFWPLVEKEVSGGLNYLVIAINDDMASMNTAMEIAKRARIWRSANAITSRFNIYVRCYDHINHAQMINIAQNMQGSYGNIAVKVFGGIEEIFNYETIVADNCMEEAKQYNWEYSKHKDSIEQCWINSLKLERTRQAPQDSNIQDSQRLMEQNISNALHKDTKLYLLTLSGYDCYYWSTRNLEREKLVMKYKSLKDNKDKKDALGTNYKHLNDKEKTILLNIARLEHERWVASMKLRGWSPTPESTDSKNIEQQLHNDMRPWDELRSEGPDREETQGYDCDVVETSIRIELNTIKHIEKR